MTTTAAMYALSTIGLVVVGLLFRAGRLGGGPLPEDRRRAGAVWIFGAAGIGALLTILYLVQHSYGGEPNVYSLIRLALNLAMIAVAVRLFIVMRRR